MTPSPWPFFSVAHINNQSIANFPYRCRRIGSGIFGRHSVAEKKAANYVEESLNTQLAKFADLMHKYVATNHFYYDAVEALLGDSELADNVDEYSHYGLTLMSHWLRQQDKTLLESLTEIKSQLVSTADNTSNTK